MKMVWRIVEDSREENRCRNHLNYDLVCLLDYWVELKHQCLVLLLVGTRNQTIDHRTALEHPVQRQVMYWCCMHLQIGLKCCLYWDTALKLQKPAERLHFFDVSEEVFAGISIGRLTKNKFSLWRTASFDVVHWGKTWWGGDTVFGHLAF